MIGCLLAVCVVAKVDAYAGADVDRSHRHLVAPVDARLAGDLQVQEFARSVGAGLAASGFTLATPSGPPPTVIVLFEATVSEPHTQTRTRQVEEMGLVTKDAPKSVTPRFGGPEFGYKVNTSPKTSYEKVGERTVTTTTTNFTRSFTASAYQAASLEAGAQPMQLWKVVVTSEGPSSDLRSILPVLVAAAQPWFGKSSGRQVDVTLKPDGPEVQAIRARSNAHSAP